jgi:hypothetical protein
MGVIKDIAVVYFVGNVPADPLLQNLSDFTGRRER